MKKVYLWGKPIHYFLTAIQFFLMGFLVWAFINGWFDPIINLARRYLV